KFYDGNLWRMAEAALPPEIQLEALMASAEVRFFLDSFNEMPREYFNNQRYEDDLAEFLRRVRECTVVISSRTEEGLQGLDLVQFRIEEIEREFVEENLAARGHKVEGTFRAEIITLLQRPLFFRLYAAGKIDIEGRPHPLEVYRSLFSKLDKEFE